MKISISLRATIAIFVFLFISGCSTPLLLDKTNVSPRAEEGLVFTTFSRDVQSERMKEMISSQTSINLVIRPLGQKNSYNQLSTTANGVVAGGWTESSITERTGDVVSLVSATYLPVGEYELISKDLYLYIYPTTYHKNYPLPSPIRFSVKQNEIVYLGAHHILQRTGENIFGMTVPSQAKIQSSDRFISDYKMLLKVRPEWKPLTVTNLGNP